MQPEMKQETEPVTTAENTVWRPSTRVIFRFVFSYFLLYFLPFPVAGVPANNWPANFYADLWHRIVPWVATHVLQFQQPITVFTNRSGDTTYDYVAVGCLLVLATLITIVWSWLDRGRLEYSRLHTWLRLFVRFILVTALLPYGANKLYPWQFPAPKLEKLLETFGQASPMGLLWTSMGASRLFSLFGGIAEFLGGGLLIFPRFTLLGAVISFAALTNVLMLNLGYDVTVKIYTFHLVMMCLVLIAPDAKRLVDFFLLNRTAPPASEVPLFARKELNQGALAVQIALGLVLAVVSLYQADGFVKKASTDVAPASLYGVWSVDEVVEDGQSRPPLITDSQRWQAVVFDHAKWLVVQQMNGQQLMYRMEVNPMDRILKLADENSKVWQSQLEFANPQPDLLTLKGEMEGHQIAAKLRRVDLTDSKFLLKNRGFHWINEHPLVQ
jgi:hypothetical protein